MARVLIVEPEPDLRQLAQDSVRELGHEAVALDAGPREADVLLLAPCEGMDDLLAKLRGQWGPLPVVCVSTEPATAETRALRPAAYLVKPYSLAQLDRALHAALTGPSVPEVRA